MPDDHDVIDLPEVTDDLNDLPDIDVEIQGDGEIIEKLDERPPEGDYKLAEVRDDGTVIIELPDGRMFPAAGVADGVKTHKRAKVELTFDSLDKDGVPVGAIVSKVL